MTQLPSNPLPSLADEILAALPQLLKTHIDGPGLADIAKHIGADMPSVRRAAFQLNSDARANLMRRLHSREQFLIPVRRYSRDLGYRYCAHCQSTFAVVHKSKRRCCSRGCGIAWSWSRPGVKERRSAGIKLAHSTPEARERLDVHNRRRWSKPGERERLSEQNRRQWADPVKKALRAQSIAAVNGSPEMRLLYSNLRKQWWKDPQMRERMVAAAKRAKNTPEFKAYFSELCRKRWRDPAWRKKWLLAVRRNAAKAGRASQAKRRERAQQQSASQ